MHVLCTHTTCEANKHQNHATNVMKETPRCLPVSDLKYKERLFLERWKIENYNGVEGKGKEWNGMNLIEWNGIEGNVQYYSLVRYNFFILMKLEIKVFFDIIYTIDNYLYIEV